MESLILWLIPIIIWELIWKGIALWKSAQNSQKAWFIVILIVNTIGLLSIIYILFFQNKKNEKNKQD